MAKSTKPMGMFLQDPSLPHLHDDFDFAETGDFLEGTGSSRFCVRDPLFIADGEVGLVRPLDWQTEDLSFARFEADGLVDNLQFHQVNVFATCTRTLGLVEQEIGSSIKWRDGAPLEIRPHAFRGMNAYYDGRSLNFGYAQSWLRRGPIWTCLSHDLVAHELGHAVLDNIRPDLLSAFHPDSAALHESFGDLLALFAALQYPAVVGQLFRDSGGDLRKPSVATRFAEEYGLGSQGGGFPFLRSNLEKVDYDKDAPGDPHVRSVIWTGAMYELLVRLVEARATTTHPSFECFVTAVVEAARWARGMLFRALHYLPLSGATLPQLARLIWEADARVYPADAEFREIARAVFIERKLWDPRLDFTAPDIGAEFAELDVADSAKLAATVMRHAAALRIPRGIGARILLPTLVSTTRRVDTVQDATGQPRLREITERYLSYGFELLVPIQAPTPQGIQQQLLPLRYGGTLVLDENWRAILLSTSSTMNSADEPAQPAIARSIKELQARLPDLIGGERPQVELETFATGQARTVVRPCNLQDHLRGIHSTTTVFPFATDHRWADQP